MTDLIWMATCAIFFVAWLIMRLHARNAERRSDRFRNEAAGAWEQVRQLKAECRRMQGENWHAWSVCEHW